MALASALPPARVAKQVRWRVPALKKQMATPHASTAALPPMPRGFVEVPSAPAWPQTAVAPQVEVHRVDGTRLCIHSAASPVPLEAVVRAFLEGH